MSVVLPVKDAADTVAQQLAALAAQNYGGRWELILVDNGSKDQTVDIVRRFEKRLPTMRVVSASERAGAAYARNVGAAEAAGDLLAYCDADDEAEPGWLDGLVIAARHAELVGGRLNETALNDVEVRAWRGAQQPPDRLPTGMLAFLPFAASANVAIWADVLKSIDGWREDFIDGYEDVELCWRAQLAGHRLAFAPDAVMRYRLRGGLRQLARQSYRYGRMAPKLYREYRGRGMPVSSRRVASGAWLRLAVGVARLPTDRPYRGIWVRNTGFRLGRLAGSARYRVLYL